MTDIWEKVEPGIRCRVHPIRKHGVRPDRYFVLRYTIAGQRKQEALGWASEGWTLAKARLELARLKEAGRTGQGPATLAERRHQAEEQRKAEAARKAQAEAEGLTFADFWQDTYFPSAQASKTPRSWKREEQLYRLWLAPVIGGLPLKDVSPLHLEKVKQAMARAGRTPRSISYCLDVARQVFNYARRVGFYSTEAPTAGVRRPRADNRRDRFLTPEEAERLLSVLALSSKNVRDMALLSLHCGLRAGEVFRLTWADVDLDGGLLTLRDTKSGRNRHAFLTGPAKAMLKARGGGQPNALVFPAKTGGTRQAISNSFMAAVEAIGLNSGIGDPRQKVTFHTLRHTFASWLVMQGTPLYTVQKLLGHSTLAMTERYSHLAPDHMREAVECLERVLAEPAKVISLRGMPQ